MNDGLVLSGGLYGARADNNERWSCLVGRALRRESGQRRTMVLSCRAGSTTRERTTLNDGLVLSGGLYDARADNNERWSCVVGRALRRESGQR